ncbi:MAG: YegP family protein [Flavobacteriales bacterium]|jgi:uncharacterized protein YegP (UPF0339 family)|nr:YegP family protein [Flavobacteriales bacterium]
MRHPKFELYQTKEYRFRLTAKNGQTILASEGYVNKTGALNGIESVKKNAPNENRFDRLESSNGKYYFNLKATNGQIIGTSEMYETKQGRDNGIQSVMENAPIAEIQQL